MTDTTPSLSGQCVSRPAWNKGKMTGPKLPLRPSHVWAIRARLHLENRTRDLAMFNLAIDSKLRGCDLMGLRVDDVAPNGYAIDRATVRQRKTGRPFASSLPSRRGRLSTTIFVSPAASRASTCSRAAGAPIGP